MSANKVKKRKNRRKRTMGKRLRRQRMLIVGKALLVVVLLGVCAVLPVFVNNAIGYVPLITVLLGLVGAFVYLQVLKHGIVFRERSNAKDCERDTDIDFGIRVQSKVPLFYFRVEAYFYVNDLFGNKAASAKSVFALGPYEQNDLKFSVRFDHIGAYSVGLEKLVICDFIRLFTHTLRNNRAYTVQVVPKAQEMARLQFSDDALIESSRAARAILYDSMDYASVRDYVPGDPLKAIHWKLSARQGKYLTRLFEVYTNPGVSILLDFYAPVDDADLLMCMFDCIVETGLAVERFARSRSMECAMVYEGRDGRVTRESFHSRSSLVEMVGNMPRISNDHGQHVILDLVQDETTSPDGQNNVVVVSASLSAELVSSLIEAKSRNRNPILFAVIPRDLVGREREDYTAVLRRLDAANISYVVLSDSSELVKGAEHGR